MDIYELTGAEIERLHQELTYATETGRRVRFALDGGLKVKVGEGMWTPALGEPSSLGRAQHESHDLSGFGA